MFNPIKTNVMLKSFEEAEKYKDLPTSELKKVIRKYKFLSNANSDIYNFIFTLLILVSSALLFFNVSVFTLSVLLVLHYLIVWEYLHKYKKSKLVSDQDKEEIDQIVDILNGYLENRENKKPL